MHKRHFLAAAAAAGALPLATTAAAQASAKARPTLLTVGGLIGKGNRGPLDKALDQMMAKHGVAFSKAFTFSAESLQALPAVSIRPTLEYDNKKHKLTGPLLTSVLAAAGVDTNANLPVGLRAVDGYNAKIDLADIKAYRMIVATHLDDQPMALGGLGPQWAVYDADVLPAFRDKPVTDRFALCPWGMYYIDVAAKT
ncbi:molybdopterin-dependent oxidoreductase [Pseudorhodoferax sp. Leaf267]|uniref:molybdopterin-dependent oxidoreductase n=1 Tax=Pseudorhodoferax sp. Leaf267 TaxID=1736316 RepID=UPI0007004FEA|nr:molybdopterin-dependent oxidoreductase [Pseudorhodoferax sp. Leaf267]KQP23517.1 molybdopterin-dependent oxidoreductase [Pseudorhodoferax sp. Leaf267]